MREADCPLGDYSTTIYYNHLSVRNLCIGCDATIRKIDIRFHVRYLQTRLVS